MNVVWILLASAAVLCLAPCFLLEQRRPAPDPNPSLVDEGNRARARLYEAWGTMAGQTRGLQRQRKLIERLRTHINVITIQRDDYKADYFRLHRELMKCKYPDLIVSEGKDAT